MAFDYTTLISDRTIEDVERWRILRNKGYANMTTAEKSEWMAQTMKGAYNHTDLNRVGNALNDLRERLHDAGYITFDTNFVAKTDWNIDDIPTAADLTAYLDAVSIIRGAMARYSYTPVVPANVGSLSYSEANDIEKILSDVDILINNMLTARYFCGEIFSGEV